MLEPLPVIQLSPSNWEQQIEGEMKDSKKNRLFADSLVRKHRAKLYPEEKQASERSLGAGAIKFKLSTGGMRSLFAALDQRYVQEKGR
ncbi:MAG: hypothetical protein KUG74_03185 [Rhodobacteraceae bacterium]|nr:hypothetical protein [Paracoccaceae bacterium]